MFVKSTTPEMIATTVDESDLFEHCGYSGLRIFRQPGKMKRLKEAEEREGAYDMNSHYFEQGDSKVDKVEKKRKRENSRHKKTKKAKKVKVSKNECKDLTSKTPSSLL
eukprot:TRINITY_DN6871_c0_g1_i3.p1 TRINITY_DN6871_c0_g1~~TRINITY_DN6871_c0_g1_i3.p1  ORF type:complete len:108 (-),score=25.14 TRINITY_DN6871_c0_g1_i3:61-384(-)